MTFLHPALLWLLPLAAVPLLLHLLTLHRLRTVELSTFRFLFDSFVQQRRQMKFLEALLAMLRVLFLLALVLVVSRPAVRHWGSLFGRGSGREVVLLVDGSASMNARTAGVAALDRARAAALAVVERLDADDRVTLVRVASRPEEVFSRFNSSAEAIRAKIEGLEASPGRGNVFAALAQVFGQRSRQGVKPVVYLFTDNQSSGWREVRDQGLGRLIPEGTRITVVHVGSDAQVENRAVVGDAPRRRPAIVGLPIVLRPRVVNHAKAGTAEVAVGVVLDEKEIARAALTLKPGESRTREVIHIPREPGVLRGRFEIPADRFPDDDSFLFTLTVVPQVQVLLVNGHPAADPFENEGLYLRTALTASAEGERAESPLAGKGPGAEFLRSIDLREIPEGQLTPEALKDAGVVVLANCGGLNPQQFAALRDFVDTGGGLIVFPGDKVNPDQYSQQFFPVPGPLGLRLTDAQLKPPEGDPEKRETFQRLASFDVAHPVLSVFDDPETHYLTTALFYRRFPLVLGGPRGDTWPLARFTTGAPALVESRFGDGTVLLAAFPAGTKWTNLPLKPEFVPLVLRMVSHVVHGPALDVPPAVPADAAAEIAVSDAWAPATGKVTDTRGRVRPLDFERSASRLLGAFDRTTEKGYYTVAVKGGRVDPPQDGAATFAVNLAPDESDFTPVRDDQIREWLPTAQLELVNASAEAQQLHGAIGDEREVWRPLIYLMFVVIGCEFLLATMSGQGGEDRRTVAERLRALGPGRWVGSMTGAAPNPPSASVPG